MEIYLSCGNVQTWLLLNCIGIGTEFGSESYGPMATDYCIEPILLDNSALGEIAGKKEMIDFDSKYIPRLIKSRAEIGVVTDHWLKVGLRPEIGIESWPDGVKMIWPTVTQEEAKIVAKADAIAGFPSRLFYGARLKFVLVWNALRGKCRVHLLGCRTSVKFAEWLSANQQHLQSLDDLSSIKIANFGRSRLWHLDEKRAYHIHEHGKDRKGRNFGFYPALAVTAFSAKHPVDDGSWPMWLDTLQKARDKRK